jgi:hypothetical protein
VRPELEKASRECGWLFLIEHDLEAGQMNFFSK